MTKRTKNRVCASCDHWCSDPIEPEQGECRRYPPVPVRARRDGDERYTKHQRWAPTLAVAWCGEWKERE